MYSLPDGAISTAIFILAIVLAALAQRMVYRLLSGLTENQSLSWRSVDSRAACRIAVFAMTLSADITQHVLILVVTVPVAWMAHSVVYI